MRHGSGEVQTAERAEAGNEGYAGFRRSDDGQMPETENGFLTYDSYAVDEVVQIRSEGDRLGTEKSGTRRQSRTVQERIRRCQCRSTTPAASGTTKAKSASRRCWRRGGGGGGGGGAPFNAVLDVNSQGNVVLHYAQPDSGTNHGTAMATQVAEILGFTTRDHMRAGLGRFRSHTVGSGLEQRSDDAASGRSALAMPRRR